MILMLDLIIHLANCITIVQYYCTDWILITFSQNEACIKYT